MDKLNGSCEINSDWPCQWIREAQKNNKIEYGRIQDHSIMNGSVQKVGHEKQVDVLFMIDYQ